MATSIIAPTTMILLITRGTLYSLNWLGPSWDMLQNIAKLLTHPITMNKLGITLGQIELLFETILYANYSYYIGILDK